ncbi:hypothetical protein WJX74_007089 [Apatococcus lobatus]|uniref:Uncharacterized protein n=1 Tax=Apatococcus lobatus TaxID=904363 RepID=A0AAW1Q906_9CHLO
MASGQSAKSGNVQAQEFQLESYIRKITPVVQQLQDEFPDLKYDKRTVAQLVADVLQFMENALGAQALPPQKPFPKLPRKLFRNYNPQGSLYRILQLLSEIRRSRGMKNFNFQDLGRRKENLEMLSIVRAKLLKDKVFSLPRIHVHPSNGARASELQRNVQSLKGEVITSDAIQAASHIVYPFGEKGDPDDGLEYMRVLERRNHDALVHHWYLPDSYDEYIPNDVAPNVDEPDKQVRGPWRVYVRWLTDSVKFNEWMNPIDYELDEEAQQELSAGPDLDMSEAADAPSSTRSQSDLTESPAGFAVQPTEGQEESVTGKRKASARAEPVEGESSPKKARKAPQAAAHHAASLDAMEEGSVDADEGAPAKDAGKSSSMHAPKGSAASSGGDEVLGPGVLRRPVNSSDALSDLPSEAIENLSQGQRDPSLQLRHGPIVPQAQPPDPPPESGGIPEPKQEEAKELYRVPAHAAWFSYTSIHDLEQKALPEFFNGQAASKTPKVYQEYRNFMINKYREDQSRRLTFTDARTLLAGDVNGILRVWTFLDSWGLINFSAKERPPADSLGPAPFQLAPSGAPAELKVGASPSPESMDAVLKLPPTSLADGLVAATRGGGDTLRLATRRDVYGRVATQAPGRQVRYFCNAMPWVECTACRYHCTKYPDVDLCPAAYADGHFPADCSSKDFVRIDQDELSGATGGGPWSDQETLLLLEGLELYGDSWGQISEHVGNRSQVQCIMHFLQLPIEDQFLDTLETPTPASAAVASALHPPRPAAAAKDTPLASAAPGERPPTTSAPPVSEAAAAGAEGPPGQQPSVPLAVAGPLDERAGGMAIPFSDVGNPIMAQVGFLASMIGPKVAAAAAKRALEVLTEEDAAAAAELDRAAGAAGGPGASPAGAPTTVQVRAAAGTALGAAAVRAKLLADREESEMRRLVVEACQAQMAKIQLKMQHYEELDAALNREQSVMQAQRMQMDAEKAQSAQQAAASRAAASRSTVNARPAVANLPQAEGKAYELVVDLSGRPQQQPAHRSKVAASHARSFINYLHPVAPDELCTIVWLSAAAEGAQASSSGQPVCLSRDLLDAS